MPAQPPSPDAWSIPALHAALGEYERQLQAAGREPSGIETYVDRARRFVHWLEGIYVITPR
jgi:hypothetical protein